MPCQPLTAEITPDIYQRARLSRDARFDGRFFVAVTSTGIFCRNICPAPAPKEQNVQYYPSAVSALAAGFRPCLRCRPDSAPGSPAWRGTDATVKRALSLIEQGALQQAGLPQLAARLGVSERYLRQLFSAELGIAPKRYALLQQLLLAKQLLQSSALPISSVALASGFQSIRSFNAQCKTVLKLTPGEIRKRQQAPSSAIELYLCYRPPYAWQPLRDFLRQRQIPELEWSGEDYYGRTFRYQQAVGTFTLYHQPQQYRFRLELQLDKLAMLQPVLQNIRRIFDLDVDITQVEQDLAPQLAQLSSTVTGLRLPGLWDPFEAGVRAILGQQVTVRAAHQLVQQLVQQLGDQVAGQRLFPTPQAIADSELTFLKMPQARRDTLRGFSRHMQHSKALEDISAWQALKGIGPWTCQYARMRGLSDPDIWLAGDAGVKNALKHGAISFSAEAGRPWRSYLTLQLWQLLAATAKPTAPQTSAAQSNLLENH
ncbi:3-methyladenine DNA glycosylase [Alishewanella longhuensis]|uniref:DNA-3-methyladenine glycosylase II n=1 Tax=Alishewanella longhuensis TaxID=1091037 RepID=A0ABQ3KST0_9ALTE|nr:AlkA N-terminal domain-containing protein [Alishewanella longhuensis]GHG59062.1 3-methyladenine DNA glycosylase [Alishewanella longhuensis]